MPKASNRGVQSPSSPIRKLASYAAQAEAEGKHIFYLNIGQPDIQSPEEAIQAIQEDNNKIVAYGPAQGSLSLRRSYAAYYEKFGVSLEEEDIFVTSGASEAIVFAISACCDPDDEVIIPEPFYANYIGFATFCSAKVIPVSSHLETAFELPPIQHFEEQINSKTKAIILCNPGNPTGKVYSKEELSLVINLVIKHDLFLIVDEVYKEFCYDQPFYSALQSEAAKEHVIVIDSVSKVFSLCGARIGFLAVRNTLLKNSIMKFAQMRLCPPYHGQLLAETAFKNSMSYLDKVRAEYGQRRDVLYAELQKIEGLKIYLPEGAFYIMAGLPVEDAEAFCKWLLSDFSYNNQTVMFAPAAGFYANTDLGKSQIRIAFILNTADICEAMACLREGLKVYKRLHIEKAL